MSGEEASDEPITVRRGGIPWPVPVLTPRQVLDIPMPPGNDADAATVRDYLVALVGQVWERVDGFSGKRPFGNSGWVWDLYAALARAGAVAARLDEDGNVEDLADRPAADRMIADAIGELGSVPSAPALPGGMMPFVSLLLRLGVPTVDGRELAADGEYTMTGEAQLLRAVDPDSKLGVTEPVGVIVGLWGTGGDVYALGVAEPAVADKLNSAELTLGADLDADIDDKHVATEAVRIRIKSGRVRAARLHLEGGFAWKI